MEDSTKYCITAFLIVLVIVAGICYAVRQGAEVAEIRAQNGYIEAMVPNNVNTSYTQVWQKAQPPINQP